MGSKDVAGPTRPMEERLIVELPGEMKSFRGLSLVSFFIYFDDKRPAIGMTVKEGVLAFSKAVHPTMTPPMILPLAGFQNRDVFVLSNAVVRPMFALDRLTDGSPPENEPGPISIASEGIFIRAWPFGYPSVREVDLNSGATCPSYAHPGGMWVADWQIVCLHGAREILLAERGKPASPERDQAGYTLDLAGRR